MEMNVNSLYHVWVLGSYGKCMIYIYLDNGSKLFPFFSHCMGVYERERERERGGYFMSGGDKQNQVHLRKHSLLN